MHINAVNTLEIRLVENAESSVEALLRSYAERFQLAPQCLGYALLSLADDRPGWVLSGHWATLESMTAHFSSEPMAELVNALIAARANLAFASFVPLLAEADAHGR